MKILPMMSRGVVFVHEDGKTFEMAPFQIFIGGSGQTVLRIGSNAFFFDKNGKFDGTESHVAGHAPDSPAASLFKQAFDLQGQNQGLAPDKPYFTPGTPGHEAETRGWGAARPDPAGGGDTYVVGVKKPVEH